MGISTVFVANRGEAALRIVRACRELGLTSVVGYSEPDAGTAAVALADDRFCLGPGQPGRSYLDIPAVLQACAAVGADAVHPGWGFLSENADFAELCEQVGLSFIGPTVPVMRRLADKIEARTLATEAGLPVAPGTGALNSLEQALDEASVLGYPLMLKAAAGGGGRGMAAVAGPAELTDRFDRVLAEAENLFRDGRVFLERRVPAARHIEVQVLGDQHGNVVHLGERDCTVQRRNQKLIEESPSAVLTDQDRDWICTAAAAAARQVGYRSAGTFEFLLDAQGNFTFLEVNTRLQVEHGISEIRTGVDLVGWMLRIANGEPLSFRQSDIQPRGHAIECRITAEDVAAGWLPSAGAVNTVRLPAGPGIRVDSDLTAGGRVLPFYDPLIAKVIAHAVDRPAAIARMARALAEFGCEPIATSTEFHRQVLNSAAFLADEHTTDFVDSGRYAGTPTQVAGAGDAK